MPRTVVIVPGRIRILVFEAWMCGGFLSPVSCRYTQPCALWQGPSCIRRHGQVNYGRSFEEGKVVFNWEDQGNPDERVDI